MALPLFHVDAFTDKPFAGNPETAFIQATDKGFNLRWFTPKVEVAMQLWHPRQMTTTEHSVSEA